MATPLRRLAVLLVAVTGLSCLTAVTSPVAHAATAPTCGGAYLVKPTGGRWQCTWDDEFNKSYLDVSKWWVETTAANGFVAGAACMVNSPRNVFEGGGYLKLIVRKEAAPFVCTSPNGNFTTQYTGGAVFSWGKFSQLYGRFEVRAAFPNSTIAGLQEALWLWPDNPTKYGAWPASGEIDIAESSSLYPDRVFPFVHYDSGSDTNVTNNYCMISNISAFHKYAVEWTPSNITIKYDGKMCISDTYNPGYPATSSAPFDQPFFVALTAGLGVAPNTFSANTPLPATTKIDYVRVWK
ncbi:MAG: hypothetical protein QOG80_2833 [Pseudonocardiales bacterium]|jgi:beta-glucanase (GH16 family)|nr:hypothetical protein [Pseudonocardiales bacterium]